VDLILWKVSQGVRLTSCSPAIDRPASDEQIAFYVHPLLVSFVPENGLRKLSLSSSRTLLNEIANDIHYLKCHKRPRRMNLFRQFVLIAVGGALPSTAFADWQYTRWGMNPQQVISASKGKAAWRPTQFPKPEAPIEELGGTYSAGGRVFDLKFSFSDNKLVLVSLDLPVCGSLLTDIKSAYGPPLDETEGPFPSWRWDDKRKGNQVTLFKLLGNCLLTYGPLDNNSGL
jgi:hypothetical protein